MRVIIDNCAVDRFAATGIDPVADLAGTEFHLSYTPDLRREYEAAIASANTSLAVKNLIEKILGIGELYAFLGFDGGPYLGFDQGAFAGTDQAQTIESIPPKPRKNGLLPGRRTDAHLIALAKFSVVITDNWNENHWENVPDGWFVLQWSQFEAILRREGHFAKAIRSVLKGWE